MPIATPEVYADMIRRAKEGGFAYPAINCTSSETVNAALRGFADAGSDGIIQFSTGGAEFASGTKVKDMVTGAVALAEFAHVVAEKYPVNVALHTDHCPKDKLDAYVRPLIALSQDRVNAGQEPLFQSHMWDGSAIDLDENLQIAEELLEKTCGREDRARGRDRRRRRRGGRRLRTTSTRSSTPPRATSWRTGEGARAGGEGHLPARRDVRQRARRLQAGQRQAAAGDPQAGSGRRRARSSALADDKPFNLVFHGGSGSAQSEIREALSYGVVKMNVDTDTQYAFTRPIVGHMFSNYDGVLKVDGEVGNKKAYDPRSYLKAAETGMAARVVEACEDLLSAGQSQSG